MGIRQAEQPDCDRFDSYKRYCNVVGNVLGTKGITTSYQILAPYGSGTVYYLGSGNSEGTVTVPADPKVAATIMRWGNYDVVNDSARWEASEVPSGIAKYANPIPPNHTLPASFFLSGKPFWWPSGIAWPPIGPDVVGGNISGLAGHANQIPACNCYLNVMKGPADGSGAPLSFSADNCYTTGVLVSPIPFVKQGQVSMSVRRIASGHVWMISVRGVPADFRLCVYDLEGRVARTLLSSGRQEGILTYFWNGTDDLGRSLARGLYVIGTTGGIRKIIGIF